MSTPHRIVYDRATGYTTAVVLHIVRAWSGKPEDESPVCGAKEWHHGYRTARSLDEAKAVAERDGVILCGGCVLAVFENGRSTHVGGDIPIEPRARPTSGMGVNSPRYELHTACCGMFLACDDSLENMQRRGKEKRDKVDPKHLVIHDLDGLCPKCGGRYTTERTIRGSESTPVYRVCSGCGDQPRKVSP